MSKSSSKIILIILAALGWFALITQLVLFIELKTASVPETIIRYFSYFTILTNLFVAIYSTVSFVKPFSKLGQFFARPSIGIATTVYIVVVGVIYNAILRNLWQPTGMQRIVDELLHTIIPVIFLAYWLVFLSKKELKWNAFFQWLLYPLLYCAYIMLRGYFSGFYPYPFMDVTKLGFKQVALNSLGMTIVFLGFSILFLNVGRLRAGSK